MNIQHSKPSIGPDDIKAVSETLASGKIAQGTKVKDFESAVSRFVGTKHAVACSSGTSALHLALLALGVGVGDEVVLPSYVCSSPYFAVLQAGATPKLADINISDYNLSAESVKGLLTNKTKAIIVPHMFGTPAEIDEMSEFGISLIEDCAQSMGAEYKGRKVGSFGELSTFSFYATKMITTGEGGIVLTNNSDFYTKLVELRDYDKKALSSIKYNYKMTDLQAALGLSQLNKLPHFIERRKQISQIYNNTFSNCDVELQTSQPHKKSVYFRYIVRTSDRDWVQNEAKNKMVICEKPVYQPLHDNLCQTGFQNCNMAKQQALSIPIYPSLSEPEIEHVSRTLSDVFQRKSAH
jgi:perosamine synthetase